MLPVCAGFAPYNRAGGITGFIANAVDIFTIAFHIALLKIGCKAVHILIVWKNGFCLCFKEIGVPNQATPSAQGYSCQIFLFKIFVHFVGAFEQAFEMIETNAKRDRKADGAP